MDKGKNSLDMLQHLTEDKPFECHDSADGVHSHTRAPGLLSRETLTGDGRT